MNTRKPLKKKERQCIQQEQGKQVKSILKNLQKVEDFPQTQWNDDKMRCLYLAMKQADELTQKNYIQKITVLYNKEVQRLVDLNPEYQEEFSAYFQTQREIEVKIRQDLQKLKEKEDIKANQFKKIES